MDKFETLKETLRIIAEDAELAYRNDPDSFFLEGRHHTFKHVMELIDIIDGKGEDIK